MASHSSGVYRFGGFTLEVKQHALRRGAKIVRLQPKTFDVLRYLVERSGRLVAKEELLQHVWRDVAVADGSLARCVADLRRQLGDDARQPRYIETVPRLGYRFVCAVTSFSAAASVDVDAAAPPRSVAVLPFVNLSANPEHEYFADGMTDLLIADLGRIRSLRVISRTSMMRYKGVAKSLAEIGTELAVDTAIEGSVLRADDRLRVTVQLVSVATDGHLWAESYERQARDIISLQREITTDVARAVHATLASASDGEMPQATDVDVSPAAQEAYLRGRFYWHRGTQEGMEKAIACFQEALAIDPRHALAYVGLADAAGVAGFFGYRPPREAFPQMQACALKALEVAPTLPEAHASLAATRLFYDWDWRAAEDGLRRALALNPNLPAAHEWLGWCLLALGRTDDGLDEIVRARDLDPLSIRARTSLAIALYFARQHDRGVFEARRALELDPRFAQAHCALGLNYQQTGRTLDAIAEFERALELSGRSADDLASIGFTYACAGRSDEPRRVLQELSRRSDAAYVCPIYAAAIHAGLGEHDRALQYLERAIAERAGWVVFLAVEPWWDPLRSNPRFVDLMRQVGLQSA